MLHWISLTVATLALAAAMAPAPVAAKEEGTVAVIGTGRVGGALGPRFASLGFDVVYGSRTPDAEDVAALVDATPGNASAASQAGAAAQADIVILAIPWNAAEQVIQALGDLSGKIIIDVTNAIKFGEDGQMELVVEVMSYRVMADPAVAGGPVTVPIVGDDAEAKARVIDLVQQLGYETEDVGPLKHAHYLEGMAVLYMVPFLQGRMDDAFEYYLRKNPGVYGEETDVRPAE